MDILLLGMGTAAVLTLIEELSPVFFAAWIRGLLGTVLALGAAQGWYGNLSFRHVVAGLSASFLAAFFQRLVSFITAAGDEKTTAIVARRYARRGPML